MKPFSFNMLSSFGLLLFTCLFGYEGEAAPLVARTTATQIFQFPATPFTTIENVALRPNGDLLLTSTSQPHLYLLNPTATTPSAQLVYTFPDATATLGITETSSDVFAVVVGNVSLTTFLGVPGSFSIWSVSFATSPPTVKEIAAVPQATILNGLTHPSNADFVLAADSEQGIIYSLNILTGAVAVAIQNSAFAPPSGSGLGINGIHPNSAGNTLYFTNSQAGTFGSIPINTNGEATGSVKIIAHDPAGDYDDFAIDSNSNAFIANHPNSLLEVISAGTQSTILNSTNILQPTSAIISGGMLYLVTDGNAATKSASGQVFAVNIA